MIKDYAIEVKEFAKENRKFCVSFDYRWVEALDDRKITTCCIIELPSKKIYAGSAIKNPNDLGLDDFIGQRLAFKRAILVLWMIWAELKRTGMPFKPFWQLFRKALAENKIYLEERKGIKNG